MDRQRFTTSETVRYVANRPTQGWQQGDRPFDYAADGDDVECGGASDDLRAARLSEDDSARVLLLEAGPPGPLPAVAVPLVWPCLSPAEDELSWLIWHRFSP